MKTVGELPIQEYSKHQHEHSKSTLYISSSLAILTFLSIYSKFPHLFYGSNLNLTFSEVSSLPPAQVTASQKQPLLYSKFGAYRHVYILLAYKMAEILAFFLNFHKIQL